MGTNKTQGVFSKMMKKKKQTLTTKPKQKKNKKNCVFVFWMGE